MKRLTACFEQLRAQNRQALIPFITAGFPNPNLTVELMHTLVKAGADIIELGIPFSDPMADGPVIQRASERALAAGTRLTDILQMVKTFRQQNSTTPIVLMGYFNPIEIMGYEPFVTTAATVGVDGVLTVDLPPEEIGELGRLLQTHAIAPIFLIAPTTTPERMQKSPLKPKVTYITFPLKASLAVPISTSIHWQKKLLKFDNTPNYQLALVLVSKMPSQQPKWLQSAMQ
jgi:tryptophan synthase alpha chain